MRGAVLLALVATSTAFVIPEKEPSVLASYFGAVDFATLASNSSLQCLRNAGYYTAFIRAYNPSGSGGFDTNAVDNIRNAYANGLGTEVYMTPQPISSKNGAKQFDEVYNGLVNNGINIRTIWIQVTSPENWGGQTWNQNFINATLNRAAQYGVATGIYTNYEDWSQITSGYTAPSAKSMLWYWSVNGGGIKGESQPNFNDFVSFGGWKSATVKQYGQSETVCSLTVNRDTYLSSTTAVGMAGREKGAPIVVGSIGL